MITTKEAAQILGVSRRRVQAMVGDGVLPAEKVAGVWLVDEKAVRERAANPVPAGRPGRGRRTPEERYLLMRKNDPVFEFSCSTADLSVTGIGEVFDLGLVPIGARIHGRKPSLHAFREWLSGRKIPDTRRNLERYLREGNSIDAAHLMFRTMGMNLTDQYWFCPVGIERPDWHDINPFENDYSHAKLNDPGCSTSGMLEKYWEKRDVGDVLVKRGLIQDREPYNEVLSTKLLSRLIPEGEYVEYWLEEHGGAACSACRGFVDVDTELVSMADIMRTYSSRLDRSAYESYCLACESHGLARIRGDLAKMLVFDYLVGNYDRHRLNLGIVRNSGTGEWLRAAPLFDGGNGFYIKEREPGRLASALYSYASLPFVEYPNVQLSLVEDYSWFEPESLMGFGREIASAFAGNSQVSDELAQAMAAQFQMRLDRVVEHAAEREPRLRGARIRI